MSSLERESFANRAAQLFIEHPLFKTNFHIACYSALQDEFDCTPIIENVCAAQKKCYLPVLQNRADDKLDFYPYSLGDTLSLNRYRILEPRKSDVFPPEKLDLVIVPLVGFDLQGNRLGRGAGYYDRTFSFLPRPFLLGLGYEFQNIEQMPHDRWDVKLNGVLTENEIVIF